MDQKNGHNSDLRTKALTKMISSNEIVTLINALGLDPKSEEINLNWVWKNNNYDRC